MLYRSCWKQKPGSVSTLVDALNSSVDLRHSSLTTNSYSRIPAVEYQDTEVVLLRV